MATYGTKELKDLQIDGRYSVFHTDEYGGCGYCFILVDTKQRCFFDDKEIIAQVYLSDGPIEASLEVKHVATHSEHRREGMMSFLLCAALQWAEESGYTSAWIKPKPENAAWLKGFYEKYRIAGNPMRLI